MTSSRNTATLSFRFAFHRHYIVCHFAVSAFSIDDDIGMSINLPLGAHYSSELVSSSDLLTPISSLSTVQNFQSCLITVQKLLDFCDLAGFLYQKPKCGGLGKGSIRILLNTFVSGQIPQKAYSLGSCIARTSFEPLRTKID